MQEPFISSERQRRFFNLEKIIDRESAVALNRHGALSQMKKQSPSIATCLYF